MSGRDIIASRFRAIHRILLAAGSKDCSLSMSSSNTGAERELFVTEFLTKLFPSSFRFGSGDVIDTKGSSSGQVDVVVESPHLYSLPLLGAGPRIHVAENVAAVIEIKSDLTKQWEGVVSKSRMVSNLDRFSKKRWYEKLRSKIQRELERDERVLKFSEEKFPNDSKASLRETIDRHRSQIADYSQKAEEASDCPIKIPFYVIGFHGWKSSSEYEKRRKEIGARCLLSLDPLISSMQGTTTGWTFGLESSLWAMVDGIVEDCATLGIPPPPSKLYSLT